MEKILASNLVIADDKFVDEITEKLKQKGFVIGANNEKEQYSLKEVAEIIGKNRQTVQKHVRNYVNEVRGARKLKAHKPEGAREYVVLLHDLNVYRGLI